MPPTTTDPSNRNAIMTEHYYDSAQHHGDTGHALFDLSIQGRRTQAAQRLAYSVAHHTDAYARSRAISRTKLASLLMATGDPRQAAMIGQKAFDSAGSLRSRRALPAPDFELPPLAPFVRLEERIGEAGFAAGRRPRLAPAPSYRSPTAVRGPAAGTAVVRRARRRLGRQRGCERYGCDVTSWAGFEVLRDTRELRKVTFAWQLAGERTDIAEQARYRLACVRGDHGPRPWGWTEVP
jgi:hypothetical protein